MQCLNQPKPCVLILPAAVTCIDQFLLTTVSAKCVPLIYWCCLHSEIQKLLEPLSSLWDMCSEFTHHLPDWMDGPIVAINAEQVATDCEKW